MAEYGADAVEVGAAVEHGGGEGVSQGMGTSASGVLILQQAFDGDLEIGDRHGSMACGYQGMWQRKVGYFVIPQCLPAGDFFGQFIGYRHDALLATFAEHADLASGEIDGVIGQLQYFRASQSGGV